MCCLSDMGPGKQCVCLYEFKDTGLSREPQVGAGELPGQRTSGWPEMISHPPLISKQGEVNALLLAQLNA